MAHAKILIAFVSKTIPIVTLWLRSPQAYCYLMVTLGQVTLNSRCFCPVPRAQLYILPPRKISVFACFARWQSLFIMCAPPSLPSCRFHVVAIQIRISRDFNQHGVHVLLEIFFFITLLFGVLRSSWISLQHYSWYLKVQF